MLVILGTSFLAGTLAILSPCVLPILPILLLSALQQHKLGPIGLVLGLSTTFTTFGLALAATGTVFGIDSDLLRDILAIMLIILGLVLIFEVLQDLFTRLVNPLANKAQQASQAASISGFWGQFLLGLILGGAWIPCTGPTLALATSLAAGGDNITQAAFIMLAYSLGVSLPIVAISYIARGTIGDKGKLMRLGKFGKRALGLMILTVGVLLITNYDKILEAKLLGIMPNWLLNLTTSY